MPHQPDPVHGPIVPRLVHALLLRRAFYESVAANPRATMPAAAILCLLGTARESYVIWQRSQEHAAWGWALPLVMLMTLLVWLAYGAVAYLASRILLGRRVEYRQLLRCLAYAETPTLILPLGLFADVPNAYPYLAAIMLAWGFACFCVAARAATGASPVRSTLIALPTYMAFWLATIVGHWIAFVA